MPLPALFRRRRLWLRLGVALALLLLAFVAALPPLLSTDPARRWLLARANRVLAPGRLDVASFRFSWFGPTVMTGFTLIDPAGEPVVKAPRAVWDRPLGRILFDRPRLGELVLDRAALDIERAEDGTVDLHQTLRPVLGHNPKLQLTVVVRDGTLRLRSPGLARPVRSDHVDLRIVREPSPSLLIWLLVLDGGAGEGRPGPGLTVRGDFHDGRTPPLGPPSFSVHLTGQRWPIALEQGGVAVEGEYNGNVAIIRLGNHWNTWGSAELSRFAADGPPLRGDQLRLDRLAGHWCLNRTGDGWKVNQLHVVTPLGRLDASGDLPARRVPAGRIDGQLDLAALARQLPHTLHLREGLEIEQADATLAVDLGDRGVSVTAELPALVARDGDRRLRLDEPLTLRADVAPGPGGYRVDAFRLAAPSIDLRGRGDLRDGVKLAGTVDLAGLRRQTADLIDYGDADFAGAVALSARYRREGPGFVGELSAHADGLRLDGPVHLGRDSLDLVANARGPADADGLPTGWQTAALSLDDGEATAALTAESRDGDARIDLRAHAPLRDDGAADLGLTGRWRERNLLIDRLTLSARPDAEAEPLQLTAAGRFDADRGELVLGPEPNAPSSAVALGVDGLRVAGIGGGPFRADLDVVGDLGATARAVATWIQIEPPELAGRWQSHWTAQTGDGLQFGGRVELHDLARRGGAAVTAEPIALDLRGAYRPESDRIDLAELVLAGPYVAIEAAGRLDDVGGRLVANIDGRVRPDWPRLNAMLRDRVEPGARVAGRPGRVRLSGPLRGEADELDAEVAFELAGADVYGMQVGPASVALALAEGEPVIRPIATTLNGGTLRLDPSINRGDDGLSLRLGQGTTIDDAAINDEVSRRVLAFVAPVLEQATRVRGRVSARLERAEFPLTTATGRGVDVEGKVLFQDVEFAPGPLGVALLDMVGRPETTIALDEPVRLSIADGRVVQRGLAIPIGQITRVELDGSVGFDRTLDLTARIPFTGALLARNPVLSNIVAGTRIDVPIRGTLSDPKVDRDAFNAALKTTGEDLLMRGAAIGGAEVLKGLIRRRQERMNDPDRMRRPRRRNR